MDVLCICFLSSWMEIICYCFRDFKNQSSNCYEEKYRVVPIKRPWPNKRSLPFFKKKCFNVAKFSQYPCFFVFVTSHPSTQDWLVLKMTAQTMD